MNTSTKHLLSLQACEFSPEIGRSADTADTRIMARIRKLRGRLSVQVLRQYDHRKVHFGPTSLVPVEDGICSGCRIYLSRRTLRTAFYRPVECEHCGRLVYNSERRRKMRLEICAA